MTPTAHGLKPKWKRILQKSLESFTTEEYLWSNTPARTGVKYYKKKHNTPPVLKMQKKYYLLKIPTTLHYSKWYVLLQLKCIPI